MDAYTAQDIIILEDFEGDWILSDFANGTVLQAQQTGSKSNTTTGYNANSLAAHDETGRQREVTIRIIKGSPDDKRLNRFYTMWDKHDLRYKPLNGQFTKVIGHGDTTMTNNTLSVFFGNPKDSPEEAVDRNGNTDQLVSVYVITFGNSERSM